MKRTAMFLICSSVLAFFLWTMYLWKFFKSNHVGSYPTAKTWSIPAKEDEVIRIINELKKEHPELDPPNNATPNHRTVRYWYLEIFHYEDTDEDIEIYLRPTQDSLYTILGFTSVMPHMDTLTPAEKLNYTSNKDINKDYGYFENKSQIKKFEEQILHPIMEKIEDKTD